MTYFFRKKWISCRIKPLLLATTSLAFSCAGSFGDFAIYGSALAAETQGGGQGGHGGDNGDFGSPGEPAVDGTGGNGGNGFGGTLGGIGGVPGAITHDIQYLDTIVSGDDGIAGLDGTALILSGGGGGGGGTGVISFSPILHVSSHGEVLGGEGGHGGSGWLDVSGSGGGGGDGGNGGAGIFVGNGQLLNTGAILGGYGGSGGDGDGPETTMAGFGGDGGTGVILGPNSNLLNQGLIMGGAGGIGGTDDNWIDRGGRGGNGIILTNSNKVTNAIGGKISGGRDGAGYRGAEAQTDGAHAIMVEGDNNIVVNNAIIESGSLDDDAVAIFFRGTDNALVLWSRSYIRGFVLADGVDNELALGGEEAGDFDVAELGGIGSDSKYQGFSQFRKIGASTWSLLNQTTDYTPWFIDEGTLSINSDHNLGSIDGELTIDGGRLQVRENVEINRRIEIDETFAIIDTMGNQVVISSLIYGSGSLIKEGSGTLILTADNIYFSGTFINEGTLTVHGRIEGVTGISENTRLDGTGFVSNVLNAGLINPGTRNATGTLTIEENYTGLDGSIIAIKAELGDDDSKADRLVIQGNSAGTSKVDIINQGGQGADTNTGIEIITIGGQSDAIFQLIGDYDLPSGTPAVIAGAYSYTLEKGSAANSADGNWYLRSDIDRGGNACDPSAGGTTPCKPVCPAPSPGEPNQPCHTPNYQPGVPLYSGYAQLMGRLNTVSTMQERVGNRYWTGASARQIAQGDGPADSDAMPDAGQGDRLTDAGLVWGRIEASHSRIVLEDSTTANRYEANNWNIRAGLDNQLYENEYGNIIGSAWAFYGGAEADLTSPYGAGTVEAKTYGVSTALTWIGNNGLYLDGQARFSWSNSDLTSETLHRMMAKGVKGHGYALSIETGQQITVDQFWTLTPQAQLFWAQTTLDSFSDPFNAAVSFDTLNSLTGRVGIALGYANTWQDSDGHTDRIDVYGITNIYREMLDQSLLVNVTNTQIDAGHAARVWGEIGMGGTYSFNDDKYGVFGSVKAAGGLKQLRDNYSLAGNVGIRMKW